jgi:hypothetical protein
MPSATPRWRNKLKKVTMNVNNENKHSGGGGGDETARRKMRRKMGGLCACRGRFM